MSKRAKNNSGWFRFYDESLDDPKVQGLPDKLYRTWVNVLCLARRNGGVLPTMGDMAFSLRLTPTESRKRITTLVDAGLIDKLDGSIDGALSPHNWEIRQYDSDVSTDRVRAFRKRQLERSETVSETQNGRRRNVSFSASVSESESVSAYREEKIQNRERSGWRDLSHFELIDDDLPSLN